MLRHTVSERPKIDAFEQRFALSEHDRRYGEMKFVDVAGAKILPHRRNPRHQS